MKYNFEILVDNKTVLETNDNNMALKSWGRIYSKIGSYGVLEFKSHLQKKYMKLTFEQGKLKDE